MNLEWSIVSKVDMKAAKEHIEKENPRAAREVMNRITTFAEGLLLMPRMGTAWNMPDTYKIPIEKTRFSIIWKFYKVDDVVKVLRVMHQSRELPDSSDDDGFDLSLI